MIYLKILKYMHCLCDSQKDLMLVDRIFKNFCLVNFILLFFNLKYHILNQKLKILNLFIL